MTNILGNGSANHYITVLPLTNSRYCSLQNGLQRPNDVSDRKNKGTFTFSTFNSTYWVPFLSHFEHNFSVKKGLKLKKPFSAIFNQKYTFQAFFGTF